MRWNGNVIQNEVSYTPGHVWGTVKGWAAEYLRREGTFDVALTLVTVGSAGFVLLTLHRIVTSCTMTGF